MKRALLLFLLASFVFSACNKELEVLDPNIEDPLAGRKALIQQRWNFDRFTHQETLNTNTTYDTIKGVMGDYFEFDANGLAYAYWGGQADTSNHKLITEDHMIYAGDTFTIVYLSATNFELGKAHYTDTTASADTIRLYRQ